MATATWSSGKAGRPFLRQRRRLDCEDRGALAGCSGNPLLACLESWRLVMAFPCHDQPTIPLGRNEGHPPSLSQGFTGCAVTSWYVVCPPVTLLCCCAAARAAASRWRRRRSFSSSVSCRFTGVGALALALGTPGTTPTALPPWPAPGPAAGPPCGPGSPTIGMPVDGGPTIKAGGGGGGAGGGAGTSSRASTDGTLTGTGAGGGT